MMMKAFFDDVLNGNPIHRRDMHHIPILLRLLRNSQSVRNKKSRIIHYK